MKLAVIGSNMTDLTSYVNRMPRPGETLESTGFTVGRGGKGANQAIAAARCGAEILMLSCVGGDVFGEATIANFKANGIDVSHLKRIQALQSGTATIVVDTNGQNCIVIHKGANNVLLPEDVDAAEEALKTCSMILLQLEIPLDTVRRAVEVGHRNGVPILLNPAPAKAELDMETVCACDFFVPNETELSLLSGRKTDTRQEIEAAAMELIRRGLSHVIVTMGARGALWMTQEGAKYVEAHMVKAVDTTGAGDAFIGCFAAHYVRGGNVLDAMRAGCDFAALSVMRRGAQASYPTQEEVEAFLAEHV